MRKRPLVLHVAEFRNPAGGGFIAGIEHLARRHGDFEIALLCPEERHPWAQRLRAAGVAVYGAQSQLDVAARIARLRPDIVHAHFISWSLPAMLGAAAARARLAWHLHSGILFPAQRRHLARRIKYAIARRLVDRFYCVSPDLVEYLLRHGVGASQIVELPNGVDLERFRAPALHERVAARRQFRLAPHDRTIAFFGRDAFVKGADRLAAALAAMPPPLYVIAVAASRESMAALSGARTIDAGHVLDVRDVFWASDALALPSRTETVTFALMEARGCAIPAAASPLPGLQQAFRDDPATIFADPEDATAFASALDRALSLGPVALDAQTATRISLDRWADALAQWYAAEAAA